MLLSLDTGVLALKIVLYATLGLLCSLLGHTFTDWEFWAFLGLFWVCDQAGQRSGQQTGYIRGIHAYINMPAKDQDNIRKLIREIQHEE